MELQQAEVLAQLSSNDPRKQVAALMLLRRDAATNPASLAPLAPFLLQRFVVPREEVAAGRAGDTAAAGRGAGQAVQQTGTTAAKTSLLKKLITSWAIVVCRSASRSRSSARLVWWIALFMPMDVPTTAATTATTRPVETPTRSLLRLANRLI